MKLLKFLIYFTLACIFALINLGGFVHNTGSSLACPDWPLCYGQIMPEMVGGVLIEHSHRLLGSLVGFLTICISFLSFRHFGKSSRIFKFSIVSLVMVIIQGILGGLTVIYKLPPEISTAHLGLSMIYFASIIYILHLIQVSTLESKKYKSDKVWNKSYLKHSWILLIAVYAQMIWGASMRHLGLGSVCGTGWSNVFKCFDLTTFKKSYLPNTFDGMFHMGHRYFAYALAALIFYNAYNYLSTFKENSNIPFWKNLKLKILILPVLVLVQIALGMFSLATNLGIEPTTLHLGVAALIFITIWKICLEISWIAKNVIFKKQKYDFLFDLFSMSKPRLSGLVIFTAGIGMFLATQTTTFSITMMSAFWSLTFTTLLVAGACTLNCYMERDIDKLMERTAQRPLPSNRINPNIAFGFGLMLCLVAVVGLYFWTNTITVILGLIATGFYIAFYTPFKKISPNAVFLGAVPGAMPPLMGYTSVTNSIDTLGIILFCILFFWQVPHFLAISMMYKNDYKEAGFQVFPNTVGDKNTVYRIVIYSIVLLTIALLPYLLHLTRSPVYLIGTLMVGCFSLYLALKGFNNPVYKTWARKFFLSTLIYLPVQLGLMIGILN